jgi:predicted acyl esterase
MKRFVLSAITSLALVLGPTASVAQTAPTADARWTVEREVYIPMRDGVRLSTDIARPRDARGPLPTILVRTPYDLDDLGAVESYSAYLEQGYAVVLQSERGRNFSEGVYSTYLAGADTDGYDTLDWIVAQPWSNGRVGSIGCSSTGESQWPMIGSRHPALRATIPASSGAAIGEIPGNDTQGAIYRGGIPLIGLWAWWYGDMAITERLMPPPNSTQEQRQRLRNSYRLLPDTFFYTIEPGHLDLTNPKGDIDTMLMTLPSSQILRRNNSALTPFDDFMVRQGPGDPYWDAVPLARDGLRSNTPALHMQSWHDIGAGEMARMFQYLQAQNTPNQYLIMGSGPHCSIMWEDDRLRDLSFGDMHVGDSRYRGQDGARDAMFMDWFDHFLKGERNNVLRMPHVQLQIMGGGGWISGDRWPLENTRFTNYYLDAGGALATTTASNGASDTFTYDPANPAPSTGGGCCGLLMALDQRPLESRRDVLTYTTPVLTEDTTVAGPIEVVLYVSSSARDTDFIVKLSDVAPDGTAINLADDGFRVRYRESFERPVMMEQGEVYEIRLTNMVTGNRFAAGHRIRVSVTSSSFPLYERNLNTGGNNFDETMWVVAENTVHHSEQYQSRIVLPVVPNRRR